MAPVLIVALILAYYAWVRYLEHKETLSRCDCDCDSDSGLDTDDVDW